MTEILSFLAVCAALWFVTRRNDQMREKTAEELRIQLVRRALLTGFGALSVVCGTLTVNHLAPQMFAAIGPGGLGGIIEGVRKTARRGGGGGGGCTYTAPNTPTVDAVVFAVTGDSLRLLGNTFVGSCDDTHDSTAFQVDTAGGTFASPQYHDVVLGAVTTDTAIAIDSGAVVDVRMRYKGAAAKSATWSGWDTLAGVSMASALYAMQATIDTISFEDGVNTGFVPSHASYTLFPGKVKRMSVVVDSLNLGGPSHNQCAVWNDNGAISPWNCNQDSLSGYWENFPGTAGNYSMRVRYPANNTGEGIWQIDLGTKYTDLWVRFALRTPGNFDLDGTGNNKIFAVWNADWHDYYGGGVSWEMRRATAADGSANIYYKDGMGGQGSATSGTGGDQGHYDDFIDVTEDLNGGDGRWMEIVFHIKAESSPSASDGIIEAFRRWYGDQNWTTLHSDSTAKGTASDSASVQGFQYVRIFSWNNEDYPQDTEFLLDNLQIDTLSLIY